MFDFFRKQSIEKNKSTVQNTISFDLDSDGKVHFDIHVLDESKEAAEKLGLMLFMINEGYYVQHIINSLDTLMKNPASSQFAQQIISTWSQHITNDTLDQENPIVSPLSFNIK